MHTVRPTVTVEYLSSENALVVVSLTPKRAQKVIEGHENVTECLKEDIKKALEFINKGDQKCSI